MKRCGLRGSEAMKSCTLVGTPGLRSVSLVKSLVDPNGQCSGKNVFIYNENGLHT